MNAKSQFDSIAELDLAPIKMKLMHKDSGEGWSQAKADAAEFEYRRFLTLMKLFPHEHVSPLFEVDIFWHYHILDTMKYAADSEQIFGYFLHHFPYSGLLGEEDEAQREQSGERMQELYEATFGEAYIRQEHAVLDWLALTPQNAWSNPTIGDHAAAQGPTAKTAWSNPTISGQHAQSQPAARTAWSNPTIDAEANLQMKAPRTAWSNPTVSKTAKTAWSNPTVTVAAKIAWSNPTVNSTAKTAWSNPTIATPAALHSATARTAWSNPTVQDTTASLAARPIALRNRAVAQNSASATEAA